MPPFSRRKTTKPKPPPAINPFTFKEEGAPEPPSQEVLSAVSAGQEALGTRRTPATLNVGFAPGTGMVPSQAMLDHWEAQR